MTQAATATTEAPEPTKPIKPEDPNSSRRLLDSLNNKLQKLNMELQRTGRILSHDVAEIRSIVSRLQARGKYCPANQALLVLRCCGDIFVDGMREDRAKLALDMWDLFQKMSIKLDVSHYNALLKVHLENHYDFTPAEFLSNMESRGIEPNRVTFQYFVGRYCQIGDMAGATAVLEHMKKNEMAINEAVFHSLILGHFKSGDEESAKGVLDIMNKSGLSVGAETHVVYLTGMIRSGQPWEAVKARLEEVTAKSEVQMHDHDYLQLMLELARVKKSEAAREVVSMLPKKSGFFQEVRNIIPQLIFEGELEVAYELFASLNISGLGSDGHVESRNRDRGLFILRAMVKSDFEPSKVVSVIKRLLPTNSEAASRLLEYCIELNKIEYGNKIRELVEKECGLEAVKGTKIGFFLRRSLANAQNEEEVIDIIVNVVRTGVRIEHATLSNDVMPKLLGDKKKMPSAVLKRLRSAVENVMAPPNSKADETVAEGNKNEELVPRQLSWTIISNAAIQYLLNQETAEDFRRATSFFLVASIPSRPRMWNASLARSYLATGDVDSLISLIFASANREHRTNDLESDETHAFLTLAHIHSNAHRYRGQDQQVLSPDQVLSDVLEKLKVHHIGVPNATAAILRPNLDSDDLKARLEEAVALHEKKNEYWTQEKVEMFLTSRVELSLGRKPRVRRTREEYEAGLAVQENIDAGNVEAAVEAFEKLVKENKKLTGKGPLMRKLIELEDMERMQRVLDLSIEVIGEERSLYDLAHNFLELGKFPQARKLLETPGLRYNQMKAKFICERAISSGHLEALEAFVRFSKLVFACDRDFLYSKLVEGYMHDPKKVADIWVTIQEEGHMPSDGLKKQIASVLQNAGAEVPFDVPRSLQRKQRKSTPGNSDSSSASAE